ncbi:MAG TPA: A24 family peptidase [Terriglobales bacterium]|nr:A24 family peptidase [Terriglobales bacterium]
MLKEGVWVLATVLAIIAGWTDWRTRRIPNWLTVPALLFGIALNTLVWGWQGTKDSLLGAGLGLVLLLPFVLVRALGAGDWKLVGAMGAFVGPQTLISVLVVAILIAGIMGAILIIRKRRVGQTLKNLWQMFQAFLTLRLPGPELTLDNPASLKIPFGVAFALAAVLFNAHRLWELFS